MRRTRAVAALAAIAWLAIAAAGALVVVATLQREGISVGGNACGGAGASQVCRHIDRTLSLEDLALARPALLIHSIEAQDAPSLARQVLSHPALEAVARHAVRIVLPASLWVCPGPYTIEAAELLADARDRVLTERPGS